MKILVVGGSSGLGQAVTEHFGADQVSRSNGYVVPDDIDKIAELSFNYDVVINCLPDSNQNKLLFDLL
jgi:NAD(P)-dependent dehydrogenase (short-subunit alcohol dehydrogenase family)